MYRTSSFRREIGMRSGPYTGGAVLLPWDAIDLSVRRKLLRAHAIAAENRRTDTRTLLAIAAACALVLVVISGSGFGHLFHPWLVQGRWFVITYGVLLAGILVPSVALARRVVSRHSWMPFERALLRLDAVEATPKGLIVRPFGDARPASMNGSHVELTYADTSVFRIRAHGSTTERDMSEAEMTLERASLTTDEAYRAGVDPFHDLRGDKGLRAHPRALPIDTTAARKRTDVALAGAIVVASFVLGGFVLELRNRLSDDAAFEYARSHESEELYDAYLQAGSRHMTEVRDDLVPRVVLNDAERNGLSDLESYLKRFPHSMFDTEARSALARECRNLGATYMRPESRVNDALATFMQDHPACEPARGEVLSNYLDGRRQEIRAQRSMQPAMRDALLGLVDDVERGRPAVMGVARYLYVGERVTTDAVREHFWPMEFPWRLEKLTGGATAIISHDPPNAHTTSLEIRDEPVTCMAGHARDEAFTAHFTLFIAGEQKADWRVVVRDDDELFVAVTGNPSNADPCVHVMP